MTLYGVNDLKQYALPTYIDNAELRRLQLKTGENYEGLINDILSAVVMANGQLLTDPLYGGMVSMTTEAAAEYPIGTTNSVSAHTEYGRPDAQRGLTSGGMNYVGKYDYMFGWTWDFLKEARRIQIDNDVSVGVKAMRDNFQKQILTRLFKSTYTAVASGRAMPIADGGTADSIYVPVHNPEREATTFSASHTHLGRLSLITQANLETAVAHIWEHGFDGPFDLVVAHADISSWTDVTSVTGYVKPASQLIQYGTQNDLAASGNNWGVIETEYGTVRLHTSARIPTKYWAVYKSFGAGDPRNPLAIRYDETFGPGMILLKGDHIREFPIESAILYHQFGANIADRCSAYICYNHTSGSYVIPTIV